MNARSERESAAEPAVPAHAGGASGSAPAASAEAGWRPRSEVVARAGDTPSPSSSSPSSPKSATSRPIPSSPSDGGSDGLPRLEKYDLLEEIGHGGMATVYRGMDPRLGREVAVKVIHRHLRDNPEVARRFVAEARAAAKLRHPGIVEVYDVSSEDDRERFLVVELIRGTTLRKILQRHPEMPAEIGAAITLELCAALEHAHAAGIVHRDVKPENVLVELPSDRETTHPGTQKSPLGEGKPDTRRSQRPVDARVVIKLTDFGIAKVLDAQGVTSTGQVLGSPAHMAPEQIEAGEVDGRTDVFALGVLLYECLVGHLPFEGKNPAQVLRRVLEGHYAPADRERPTVGGRWAAIVAGALAHDPAHRTASPGELRDRIREELEALGFREPRAEIAAYFQDPEAYARAHAARLVPLLVARGERARREGDVQGAAADFNRALALAPNDLAILKRVTSLSSAAGRRQLVRRVGAIAAASVTLGFAAYGAARVLRRPPVLEPTVAVPASGDFPVALPAPPAPVLATARATPSPSGVATAETTRPPRLRASPSAIPAVVAPSTPGAGALRRVRFQVNPAGAIFFLDGTQRKWFAEEFRLEPGPHHVEVRPPPGSRCCKPAKKTIDVQPPPPDAPNKEMLVRIALPTEPATLSFVRAPPNAKYFCPLKGLTGLVSATETKTVTLDEAQWSGQCTFSDRTGAAITKTITLRSGEPNVIPWPGG